MKKSTFIKLTTIITFLSVIAIACSKSNGENAAVVTNAIIRNSGSVAADGCGWTLKVITTDSTYSPVNLPERYKVDSLKVHVRFHPLTTKFNCGWGAKLREVTIDNITKIP